MIIQKMNAFGKIAVCGSISSYNNDVRNLPKGKMLLTTIYSTDINEKLQQR